MKSEIWAPGAQLMESMRAVGYSLTTALADVIDNSLSAEASRVDVMFSTEGTPYISILDNGFGMNPETARHAMQLAGTSAIAVRGAGDLGRFGLGLKTASLSQCRRLTVITKRAGLISALVWDLDHIVDSDTWSLLVLDEDELAAVPHFASLEAQASGTLVVWQNLDKALEGSAVNSRVLDQQMVDAADHLSLVFHRFLAGDAQFARTTIAINYVELEAADPFLAKSPRTQTSDDEVIDVEGRAITVKAYTLPFLAKMTAAERRRATIAGNLRDSQGFYVYRGGRLVIWGTWFRLMPKNDSGKLTRVKVDIPNSLDHLWSLDIKKSSAVPPTSVRDRLRLLAAKMVEPGTRVHTYRGLKAEDHGLVRPWEVSIDRDTFRYSINRSHPLAERLAEGLSPDSLRALESFLQVVESTFPAQDLMNRTAADQAVGQHVPAEVARAVLLGLWRSRLRADPRVDAQSFVEAMMGIEPFDLLSAELGLATWLVTQTKADEE